jgi:DNA invertase Pin-like site-specific DNA recombinase
MPRTIKKVVQSPRLDAKKRVAAYARVSSGKDAMLHSLSAQVSYYSNLIQSNPDWLYAGVYSDEAKTGTKENRDGFLRLVADCRDGRINMVITKSISRFARNTVTLLETVREFKLLGVDVYFEEQNIHTMSADGELMLSILASYAQEESLSASENQKWRIRKGFEKGELINWRFLLGYNVTKAGITIDEDSAMIVREIFSRVIAGESFNSISRDLNDRGLTCALGGRWCAQRIRETVANEKYTGNAMLQKRYRNNHLEKKLCRNTGELPMFYAEETHPAIIDDETFASAQAVLQKMREATKNRPRPQKSEFTSKIYCPYCGKAYKRNTSNGSVGWNCSTFLSQGKAYCHGKKIPEATLKAVCAEVLGTGDYNSMVFDTLIERIEVPEDNHLRFIFKDGRTVERTWADRSRRESWTDEMRAAARQKALERRRQQ